jgi:hypothetical protein
MTSTVDALPFYNAAKKTTQMMELMQRFSTCGSVDSFIHSFINGSTAPCWALASSSDS